MAEYYKYVARDADSQINYAEVGQQAVDMLQNFNETREAKKEAYRQAARESINNLMEAPQGKDQTANDFISNYAQDMINQQMANKKSFERGDMNERQYTLSMQNQMDGTKRLFNLQKLYQEEFESTMQGINDKKLQSGLTIFNQSTVEGAANFNNSKAFIDPIDGTVSIGLMENKVIDGKVVKVLNPNTAASAAVWTGRIMQKPIYFDVDSNTKNFVDGLGTLKVAVYNAANTLRAGTITDLTGLEFVKSIKDPTTRAIVNNFNEAINSPDESYLSPLNVSSILTDDLRKYNDKSFTFDKNEADKDPKKILVKIDPVTQMTTLDETAKNYKAQKEEAKNFIKTKILSKLDEEKKISTTGQLSESEETRQRAGYKYRTGSGEAPPPIVLGETLKTSGVDESTGNKIDGVSSGLENLTVKEDKGDENVAKSIGWNRITGALELRGYQASGREEEGRTTPGEIEGVVGKKGKSTVQQKDFVSSDKQNSRLLTLFVTKIPNPDDPNGGNFRNVTQARNYFKKEYQRLSGNPLGEVSSNIPTASNSQWLQNGWNQSQINEAVKLGKIKVQ